MKNETINIDFNFAEPNGSCVRQLNALLAAMELRDMELYIDFTSPRDMRKGAVSRRCGTRGSLVCELASGGGGHRFQIDTQTAMHTTDEDEEIFIECWCKKHLDRVLHTVIVYSFGEVKAYVLVHRERM